MAQTSLGVTVWSKWVGGGLKEAHREISQLEDRMRKVNSSFLLASGRSSMLKTSMFALAPAVKTVAGVMAGTAASAGAGFLAAAAGAGAYLAVVKQTITKTMELRKAGAALTGPQEMFIKNLDKMKDAWSAFIKENEASTLTFSAIGIQGLTEGIKHLQPIMDMFSRVMIRSAAAFRDWTERSDGAARASRYIAVYGSQAMEDYSLAVRHALAGLGFGFREALKNMDNMNKGVVGLMASFRQWAEGGGFQRFFEWVAANRGSVQAFFDALVAAFKNLTSAVGTLGPIMLGIATVILNFIARLDPDVIVAFYLAMLSLKVISHISALVLILATAVKGLAAAFLFLQANPIVLAIIAIVAVFVLLWVKVEAFRNFWKATWDILVTSVRWAWENVLKPIYAKIGEGFVWLWEHAIRPSVNYIREHWDEWVRAAKWAWDNILWPVFQALGDAAMWVWNSILRPVISKIAEHWDGWMQTASRAWDAILKPVFIAIGDAASWLWENVLRPVFSFIASHWDEVCRAMMWVWDHILRPVFEVLGEVVKFLWNTVLSVVFEAISVGFRVMVEVIAFLWNRVLEPAFRAMGEVLDFVWTFVVKPVLFLIGENFKIMVAIIKYVWDSVLKPLWDLFATVITWLWENVIRPTFGYISDKWDTTVAAMKVVWETVLKPMWDNLVGAFDWVKTKIGEGIDAIGRFWDGLKEKVKAPVEWIINTVWNNGLVKAWNWVNDLWGGTDIQPFSFNAGGGVAGRSGGGMQTFATGGPVHGPGSGTSDSIPARLSNGEHVWTAREVQAAGGHAGVAALRSAALGGKAVRAVGAGPGFAEGGGFWDGVRDFFVAPHVKVATNVAPSLAGFENAMNQLRGAANATGGLSMNGEATEMLAMVKKLPWIVTDKVMEWVRNKLYPRTAGGQGMGWQQMWDIVRGAFSDATMTSNFRAGDPGFHGSGHAIDVAWPMTEHGRRRMMDLNQWLAQRYPDSSELIHTPGINLKDGRPFTYSDRVRAQHYNHVHWAMAGMGGAGGGGGGLARPIEEWRSLVLQELAHFGQSPGLADTVLRRMQQESSGNAGIVNTWDDNAKRGTPSKGLMQVIDPTFNAFKSPMHPNNIFDPGANVHASMAYAIARYGSLAAAYNRPGGYNLGTFGARSGLSWVGENGAELVNFRGGEQVLNRERLRRMAGVNSNGGDRPLVDTGGAPLIDARGSTKEAVDALNKDTLPKINQMLRQLRGSG